MQGAPWGERTLSQKESHHSPLGCSQIQLHISTDSAQEHLEILTTGADSSTSAAAAVKAGKGLAKGKGKGDKGGKGSGKEGAKATPVQDLDVCTRRHWTS